MDDPAAELIAAVKSLNEAVYAALRAGRLEAACRAMPAYEVTVKPLEWTQIGDFGWIATDELFNAGVQTLDPDAYNAERAARIRSALTSTPAADVARLKDMCRTMPDIPGLPETYQPRSIAMALDGYITALARMKEAKE